MARNKIYAGIDSDPQGGMNPTGNIIRDAWVFGLLPEEETCAGWAVQGIEALYDQVAKAWEPYAGIPSRLPPELRERHHRIYEEAVKQAKAKGWDPDGALRDEA